MSQNTFISFSRAEKLPDVTKHSDNDGDIVQYDTIDNTGLIDKTSSNEAECLFQQTRNLCQQGKTLLAKTKSIRVSFPQSKGILSSFPQSEGILSSFT